MKSFQGSVLSGDCKFERKNWLLSIQNLNDTCKDPDTRIGRVSGSCSSSRPGLGEASRHFVSLCSALNWQFGVGYQELCFIMQSCSSASTFGINFCYWPHRREMSGMGIGGDNHRSSNGQQRANGTASNVESLQERFRSLRRSSS